MTSQSQRPSRGAPPLAARILLAVFCSVFIAAGCGVMAFGLRQRGNMAAARDWPLAAGTVERVEVHRHWQNGTKGRRGGWMYEPYTAYAYEVDGRRFVNDRRGFVTSSSSKPDAAQRFVEEHPVGAPVAVRFNPADPADSVLADADRPDGEGFDSWFLIAFGSVFALFGSGFLIAGFGSDVGEGASTPSATGVLRRKGRGSKFVQTLVFTVMWCSLTALLDVGFLHDIDWPPKGEDWIPLVMLGGFSCIGVGLLVRMLKMGLRLGGPHLEITCGRGFVARDGETTFSYRLVGGRVEDVESVVIRLVAWREEHVRRRDEARIEARAAFRAEVLRAATPHEIGQGFFRVELPADAPAGGPDGRETVRWELAVSGHCRNRPGFSDTYPIQVRG